MGCQALIELSACFPKQATWKVHVYRYHYHARKPQCASAKNSSLWCVCVCVWMCVSISLHQFQLHKYLLASNVKCTEMIQAHGVNPGVSDRRFCPDERRWLWQQFACVPSPLRFGSPEYQKVPSYTERTSTRLTRDTNRKTILTGDVTTCCEECEDFRNIRH